MQCQMSVSKKIYQYRDFAAGVLSVRGPLPSYDPTPPHTLYTCIKYSKLMEGGGESQPERRLDRGAIVYKAGQK